MRTLVTQHPIRNTASHSYGKGNERGEEEEREDRQKSDPIKILRIGIDSLYLSYQGEITEAVEQALIEKKQYAQSRRKEDQALAQYEVAGHLFEVKPGRQGLFPYILEDGAFRISLASSESRKLPFAYCKISADLLAHKLPEQAEEELSEVLYELSGNFDLFPTVSRVDLFVDFQTEADIGAIGRDDWITRAGGVDAYSRQGEFTGWVIGAGGPISARLYNKTLELQQKNHKAYLVELWRRAGMIPDRAVWRLEFQLRREVLEQLAVRGFSGLLRNQGGVWLYATHEWLRLAIPQANDSNRARWPTHSMWAQLAEIRWRLDDVPLVRKHPKARIPAEDRLFRMSLALLTSFMAIHGITKYRDGLNTFNEQCEQFHRYRCEDQLMTTLEDLVEVQVQAKGRQYSTLRTVPSIREEATRPDEVDRDAIDYNNASRGE